MKLLFFSICILILFFGNCTLYGQELLWKKVLTEQSFGESISKTNEGNFILGGFHSLNKIPLFALYDTGGNNSWVSKICTSCSYARILFSKELEDGSILLVTSQDDVIITDNSGLQIDTSIKLSNISGLKESIVKVLDINNELIISSAKYTNNKTHDVILRRIRIEDLKIISQEIRQQQSGIISQMAIMKDHSLIECQTNQNDNILRSISPSSQIMWEKNIGVDDFYIHDMIITNDQNILILGSKTLIETNYKYVTGSNLLALNAKGDSLWQEVYSPSLQFEKGIFYNTFNRIKETKEGDFIIIGSEGYSNIAPTSFVNVSKINAQGQLVWEYLEKIKEGGNEGTDFLFDADQNIVVVGTGGYTDYSEPERAFIMKLTNPLVNTNNLDTSNILLYPNPCRDELTFENKNNGIIDKIELYGIQGNYLETVIVNKSNYNLNTRNLTSGIYLCKLFVAQNQFVKKFCKI